MSPAPCGRVVLCWLSLRCPFGRRLLSGALWCAGPRWCRIACSPRGVGGLLVVLLGDGCGGGGGGWFGDVEDVAADVRARTFVALVAVVARGRGGGLVMVAVVLRGESNELSSRVPLAIILATAA